MNTILIHRSISRPCTSRDKYMEGLHKAVDVLLMPVWSLGYKPTPWWCEEGAWMNFICTIPEEEEEEKLVEADDGAFPLGDIDVEGEFSWAEWMANEDSFDDARPVEVDDGEFPLGDIDVEGEFGWAERMAREDSFDDARPINSQGSFVEPAEEAEEKELSPMDTRPTGEELLKLVQFMTKATHIGKARRGRLAATAASC